jgi:cyanophycinase
MSDGRGGPLFAIGGHEDKKGKRAILSAVAKHVVGGRLVIATVASHEPDGYFEDYSAAFGALGVTDLAELYVSERAETVDVAIARTLAGAAGVFFTGGDQLRIMSQIGDTPIEKMVRDIHRRGGVIAGTSAGAAAQGSTILVAGSGSETHRIGDLQLVPGLALIRDVIIDQHFAERGRIGRLLGAIARNPRLLGIGIDEDTAIKVDGSSFEVLGSGGVTILDATGITSSNIAEAKPDQALSLHNVTLHALSAGDRFDLATRRPAGCGNSEIEREAQGI